MFYGFVGKSRGLAADATMVATITSQLTPPGMPRPSAASNLLKSVRCAMLARGATHTHTYLRNRVLRFSEGTRPTCVQVCNGELLAKSRWHNPRSRTLVQQPKRQSSSAGHPLQP